MSDPLVAGFGDRGHHAADAGAARGVHRGPARDRGARRPRGPRPCSCAASTAPCACSCATCSACRRAFANPVRDAVARGTRPRRAARCSRRASTPTRARARSPAAKRSAGSRPTATASCSSSGACAAARGGRRGRRAGVAARRPVAAARRALDQPARPAVRADVRGARRDRRPTVRASARSPTSRSIRSRSGPSASRCRATGSARSAPRSSARAGGTDGAAVGRDRRREPVPRPPPEQRLPRRRLRRSRAARPRRRRGVDAVLARRRGASTVDGPDGRAGAHRRRDARVDACSPSVSAGRRVPVELVEWTIGPVRLVSIPGEAFHALGRAIEAHADRTCSSPVSRPSGTATSRCRSRDGYEESMSYGPDAVAAIARALTAP